MFLHLALLLATARGISGNAIDTYIVGGDDVPEGGRPFQVSLDLQQGNGYFHFCGGSILNEKWVITAAHCIHYKIEKTSILSGTTSLTKGGKRHEIEKIIVHENFKRSYIFDWDIALLKIKDSFSFDNKTAPIELAKEDTGSKVSCIASGWGYVNSNKKPTDKMKMVTLDSLSNQECKESKLSRFQNSVPLTERQICTYRDVGKGICQGDSGGPLTCNGELVGLTSYNVPCAQGYPDVYTRVFKFKDWIAEKMK